MTPIEGVRANPALAVIAPLVILLQIVVVATPVREVFKLEPLGVVDLAVTFAAGLVVYVATRLLTDRRNRRLLADSRGPVEAA